MPSPLDLAAELARRAATTTKTISPSEHRVFSPSPSRVVAPRRVFCDGTEQFLAQMHETQFERYWDAIAPYTFRSVMLPLGVEELKALSAAHAIAAAAAASATSTPPRHYPNSSTAESIEAQSPSRWSVTSVAATAAQWPAAVDLALTLIQAKVEAGMAELGNDKVFVRLSTRSPKDVTLALPGFDALLANEVAAVEAAEAAAFAADRCRALPPSSPRNRHLHAIYTASTAALATVTGAEAVARMVLSQRIQEDLRVAADRLQSAAGTPGVHGEPQPFNLVVREFAEFDVRNEIRGFVFEGKFTALTQYNQLCYFPSAVAEKAATAAAVDVFMAELIPRVTAASLESFVVDLVVLDDGSVKVIEINPFAEYAGSGLFAWESSADLAVLTGAAPFEYRVVERLPSDATIESEVAPAVKALLALMAQGGGGRTAVDEKGVAVDEREPSQLGTLLAAEDEPDITVGMARYNRGVAAAASAAAAARSAPVRDNCAAVDDGAMPAGFAAMARKECQHHEGSESDIGDFDDDAEWAVPPPPNRPHRPAWVFHAAATHAARGIAPFDLVRLCDPDTAAMRGPAKQTNWLVPGRVLCGACPGVGPYAGVEIGELLQAGVGVDLFVNLVGNGEALYGAHLDRAATTAVRPAIVDRTIGEFQVAGDTVAVAAVADMLRCLATPLSVVYLHCRAGHGRTGMIAALLLGVLLPDMPIDTVLFCVQSFHDQRFDSWDGWPSPETQGQTEYAKNMLRRIRGGEFPQLWG